MDKNQVKDMKDAKERLDIMLKRYLDVNPMEKINNKTNEIELRFGGKSKAKPISKIDYDNVAKILYQYGFKPENPNGFHSLRIKHEYTDINTGKKKMSNIRSEIVGIDLIQEFCKTNSLQKLLDLPSMNFDKLKFTQKTLPKNGEEFIYPVTFEDFNMMISYQLEQNFTSRDNIVNSYIRKWSDLLKTYRLINRVRFVHDSLPIFADLSIIKQSKTTNNGKVPMKTYTIQQSEIFDSLEKYDIEMELDNSRIGLGTSYNTLQSLRDLIKKVMRIVLSGLQQTNYPISYKEEKDLKVEYMKLLHGEAFEKIEKPNIGPENFIGPNSVTLLVKHLMDLEDMKIPNIKKNYTVTDKADGDRKMLFINDVGNIYLIDTNMNLTFTGAKTTNSDRFMSLLDGEHIKCDKNNKVINLYAAFDLYYINKKSIRDYPFVYSEDDELLEKKPKYRLKLLNDFVRELNPKNIMNSELPCSINIIVKKFEATSSEKTIFECCSNILSDVKDNVYEYNTDGLIFTPSNKAVGSDVMDIACPLRKTTWEHSFKWKPPEYNTIDFLVSIKKDKTGKDEIHNIFQDGTNVTSSNNIVQYKTLILNCGYDEKKHGYLDPFNDIINEKEMKDVDDNENKYKAVKFQPSNPYDKNACYANIILKENGNQLLLTSEENEVFEENTIVEFKYDLTREPGWRWVPIRVRNDKTIQLKEGRNQFGNPYHVANENWQSIHNPVSFEMITEGKNVPDIIENLEDDENSNMDDGIYYNRDGNTRSSQAMRDFHNYIKRKLITSVSERKNNLIDYAVGQGGDLHKWIQAKLDFVLGIDISRDNIHNRMRGACARYLNELKDRKTMLSGLFINGNSAKNIRNGDAFKQPFGSKKDEEIALAVFGNGTKDIDVLGKGVYKNYGKGADGFEVSSCQFSLHYFFENGKTLHNFVRNLAECTKTNGYFIGCCYDGLKVFNLLSNKNIEESILFQKNNKITYQLTKKYSQTGFPNDETSLGYAINCFQDTIGKTYCEYLVNFNYFERIMENYGFVLISEEEAKNMNFPNGTGMFEELYAHLMEEIKQNKDLRKNYKSATLMDDNERTISFLNRYFIFKKVRNVDAEKIMNNVFSEPSEEKEIEEEKKEEVIKIEEEKKEEPQIKIKAKKIVKKKIKIVN